MDTHNPIINQMLNEEISKSRALGDMFDDIIAAVTAPRTERLLDRELKKCVEGGLAIATRKSQEAFRNGNRTDAQFYGSMATALLAILQRLDERKGGR